MKYYRFKSIHTVQANSEDEAREVLKGEVQDFVNNAVVIALEE